MSVLATKLSEEIWPFAANRFVYVVPVIEMFAVLTRSLASNTFNSRSPPTTKSPETLASFATSKPNPDPKTVKIPPTFAFAVVLMLSPVFVKRPCPCTVKLF